GQGVIINYYVPEARPEAGGQLGVDFDGLQVIAEGSEVFGEDAFAGTDLHDDLARPRLDSGHNFLHRSAVSKEMLPPFLFWTHV
ncbi:MAG TPA: hypothetical protein VIO12_12295, partial [Thermoanaerobaculia bacterium]